MQNDLIDKEIIVHFVANDKFTAGYINFFKLFFSNYEHIFFLREGKDWVSNKIINNDKVYYYSNIKLLSKEFRKVLIDSQKIIISGFFGFEKTSLLLGNKILRKVYIQFWGGDFYSFRDYKKEKGVKQAIRNVVYIWSIKKCHALIFLIEGEEERFFKITGVKKDVCFIAPMPSDPVAKKIDYSNLRFKDNDNFYRIIVGNSATKENNHIEAFNLLEKFRNEEIEIICPLSYGDMDYAEKVIKEGYKKFGDKFKPLKDYMDKNDYVSLLSNCDIGIFNNDRQQGLGNIYDLLRLGKKVYIKTDISTYSYLIQLGYKVFDIESIKAESFDNFVQFNYKKENIFISDEIIKNEESDTIKMWSKVLC